MSIKKEPAKADPTQYNYITKVAKRLRNAKTSVLDMLSHPAISDVGIKGGEFEFMIEDFEAFYEESEGCHIYIEHHDSDNTDYPYKAFFRLYNNRFSILLTHRELNKLRKKLNKEDYTDRVSKDVYGMTVGELVNSGYVIQVSSYYPKSKEEAKKLLEEFEQIHDVEDNHSDGFGWFSMGDGNVDISVFYD